MSAGTARPWLDADGLEIIDGHVILNGRFAPPRFQMADHDAPGFGGDRSDRAKTRCHCDKCRLEASTKAQPPTRKHANHKPAKAA